jgi:hypothetical protein
MNEPLPPDYNPTMRLPASGAHRLSPDMIRNRVGDEVEISVRDFFLACDPSPEELAEVDRKRKELGLRPLFQDDLPAG